ncbi:ThiF family adenylyltransferase [Chromobacterium vaccinii]|uniref:ThiF family adenylyltransferase n=1 Tax=Chromobacterium vaccinii TaxID=1108595 RepID=UPI001E494089|nr:ThiF family adenylyltransferase [Chromobacterium vaccinii]MCD4484653.1 ThiF family adenylyltransferase [Chromobacterium vaccinii]
MLVKPRHSAAMRAVSHSLRGRGFTELNPKRPEWLLAEGLLQARDREWRAIIEIQDWDFIKHPTIIVPDIEPGTWAHIDPGNSVCYLAQGQGILNRHTPAETVELCLQLVESILSKLDDTVYQMREITSEFEAHWRPSEFGYLYQDVPHHLNRLIAKYDSSTSAWHLATTEAGFERQWNRSYPCIIVPLLREPTVHRQGPPSTLGELLEWLHAISPRSLPTLTSRFTNPAVAKDRRCLFLFHHDAQWCGAAVEDLPLHMLYQRNFGRLSTLLLNSKFLKHPIRRVYIQNESPSFIHHRSLVSDLDLSGLRIHLVGAGAVGGYLANAIAKLGAGTGVNGKLVICDIDHLKRENIGRHILGDKDTGKYKAYAMTEYLQKQLPSGKFEEIITSAVDWADIFDADLVIDGTGEEPLSSILAEKMWERLSNGEVTPPLLHGWVKGNGEAVQALWSERYGACFDCLKIWGDGTITERWPVLKTAPEGRIIGCSYVTPYAVSAPMMAAALMAQMAIDWRNGHLTDGELRTVVLSTNRENIHPDCQERIITTPTTNCQTCTNFRI